MKNLILHYVALAAVALSATLMTPAPAPAACQSCHDGGTVLAYPDFGDVKEGDGLGVKVTRIADGDGDHTWLASVVVKDEDDDVLAGPFYYDQYNDDVRFATKEACETFRASGDPGLASANTSFEILAKRTFGPAVRAEYLCTVEVIDSSDDDDDDEPV